MKKLLLGIIAMVSVIGNTSFAGWQSGSKGWWYESDGGYYADGWAEINGSWYYFDNDGWMLSSSYTPDGYYVDSSGAWNGGTSDKNVGEIFNYAVTVQNVTNINITNVTNNYYGDDSRTKIDSQAALSSGNYSSGYSDGYSDRYSHSGSVAGYNEYLFDMYPENARKADFYSYATSNKGNDIYEVIVMRSGGSITFKNDGHQNINLRLSAAEGFEGDGLFEIYEGSRRLCKQKVTENTSSKNVREVGISTLPYITLRYTSDEDNAVIIERGCLEK